MNKPMSLIAGLTYFICTILIMVVHTIYLHRHMDALMEKIDAASACAKEAK